MLMQPEENNKIGKLSRLKVIGRTFCPFLFLHLWVGLTKDPFSTPYHCVSPLALMLSPHGEKGCLSHQLTELGKEVVFPLTAVLEMCPTLSVSHMVFALPLGAKLRAHSQW